MEIIIKIPKEFEEEFNRDKFEDSLARVASDIESFGFQLAGRYEQETIKMLREVLKDSVIIPKGHGRLIDADAFIATLEDASKRQMYNDVLIDDCLTVDDVFKAIIESLQNKGLANGDAPTIIEAESEK